MVVVDEFHHAEAPTYRRLLDHLAPRELLGLTATPERTDGDRRPQRTSTGGRAFELRLWDALRADLLVPFHYFGVADGVDLAGLEWNARQLRRRRRSTTSTPATTPAPRKVVARDRATR